MTGLLRTLRASALAASLFSALLVPAGAHAGTLHVEAEGTAPAAGCGTQDAPCPSLEAAAAIAASGDVIELSAGEHADVAFTVPVMLRIVEGPASLSRTKLPGGSISVAAGVSGVTIAGNDLRGDGRMAIGIDDTSGQGPTTGVVIASNTIRGYRAALQVTGDAATGIVLMHGNRILDLAGAPVVNVSSNAFVDARRNWWGSNAGTDPNAVIGADVGEALQLEALPAGTVLPGGSDVVSFRLAAPGTSEPEETFDGFSAALIASSGTLDTDAPRFRGGIASALITAGTELGLVMITATLDAAQVTTTLRVVSSAQPAAAAAPGFAQTAPPRFFARIRIVQRGLSRALSNGITQVISTNRPASVRTTLFVSARAAKKLGLRPRTSPTQQEYIVGSARTRAVSGRREVTVHLTARSRYAIRRSERRVTIFAHTQVRTRSGALRETWRRVGLAGNVA